MTSEGCRGVTKPATPSPGHCSPPFRMQEDKFSSCFGVIPSPLAPTPEAAGQPRGQGCPFPQQCCQGQDGHSPLRLAGEANLFQANPPANTRR